MTPRVEEWAERVRAGLSDEDEAHLTDGGHRQQLARWVRCRGRKGRLGAGESDPVRALERDLAALDAVLEEARDAALRAPAFERLEAAWLGLARLVAAATSPAVQVRVLPASAKDLREDLEDDAVRTQLYWLVYTHEAGMPGRSPFGLLVLDHPIGPDDGDDLGPDALHRLAQVAEAACVPLVAGGGAALLGPDRRPTPELIPWRAEPCARFVGLAAPRVLLHGRPGAASGRCAWGNPAYLLAVAAVRSVQESGWVMVPPNDPGVRLFRWADGVFGAGVEHPAPVELALGRADRARFAESGLLVPGPEPGGGLGFPAPVAVCPPSLGGDLLARMIDFCRVLHALAMLSRQLVGRLVERSAAESDLNDWVKQYVMPNSGPASAADRTRYPFRAAQVRLTAAPDDPSRWELRAEFTGHDRDEATGLVLE